MKLRPAGKYGLLMVFPALIYVAIFTIYPFANAVYLSVIRYKLWQPQTIGKFVGSGNFLAVISNPYFIECLINTLLFTFLCVILIVSTAVGVSFLLNEDFKGVNIVRFLILIPWALPPAAAGLVWLRIFESFGWVNRFLILLGALDEPVYLITANRLSQIPLAMIAQLWQQLPFCSILLMAAQQIVPRDMIDSSLVDGASSFQRFRYVILPYIRNIVLVITAWEALLAFTNYDVLYTFSGGTWGLLSFYVFAEAFQWGNLGNAAALSLILATVSLAGLLLIFMIISPKKIYEYTFTAE